MQKSFTNNEQTLLYTTEIKNLCKFSCYPRFHQQHTLSKILKKLT